MTEHFSASDIEKEAKALKRDLEGWREVVLPLNSILLWEKNSYCGLVVGASTILFSILWIYDPSILTALSFIGLLVVLGDYLVPTVMQHICEPGSWTATKERQLEAICKLLVTNKFKLITCVRSILRLRQDRAKLYYIVVAAILLTLSWIGNSVNNLFLTYLFVTFLLLLPGIKHNGFLDKLPKSLLPSLALAKDGSKKLE